MRVKIGNVVYDSKDTPILLTLSKQEKELIQSMTPEMHKFCAFPTEMVKQESHKEVISAWMKEPGKPPEKPIKYEKNMFCKALDCIYLDSNGCTRYSCIHDAKTFHKWLKQNGFELIYEGIRLEKEDNDGQSE